MIEKYATKIQDLEVKNRSLMARLYIIIAIFSIVSAQGMIKISHSPIQQILYHRGLLVVTSNVWFFSKKPSVDDHTKDFYIRPVSKMVICILSTSLLAIQAPLFFIGMKMVSIGESHVLISSNTIWGQFMAMYLLNEPLTWKRIQYIAVSIIGLILIVRPPFIFESSVDQSEGNEKHFLGSIIILCCAFVQACSLSLIKKLGEKVPPNIQTTYFHLEVLLVSGVMLMIDEVNVVSITFDYVWKLIAITVLSYTCHVLNYRAYSLYSFAKLAPLNFLGVVYGIMLDIIFFQIFPGLISIIGCLLVSGAVIFTTFEKID